MLVFSANQVLANVQSKSKLGTIKGIVIDESGKPIVGAVVSIFRASTSKLLKQVYTNSDGTFLTRVFPGTYKISASADGYNSQTIEAVQISRSSEFSYGFKLERIGSGRTLPEKNPERNSPKYVIRTSKLSRSIYQNSEGDKDFWNTQQNSILAENSEEADKVDAQTTIQYLGKQSVAFARFQPLSENVDLFIIGQIDSISFLQQRLQTHLKYRFNRNHNLHIGSSFIRFKNLEALPYDSFSQISFELSDEWKLREGLLIVLGLDYAKPIGQKGSLNPKVGIEAQLNSSTRVKSSFSPVSSKLDLREINPLAKDTLIIFSSPAFQLSTLASEIDNRFEVSMERDLNQQSNLEVAFFIDKNQMQETEDRENSGFRIMYSRRLNNNLSALAGYAFSRNQKDSSSYQSFLGQINANLKNGTRLQAILRLSSKATVLAADPFQNQLTVYDPGLSVFVTHPLPNLGLPIRAEAIIDARNIFDFQPYDGKRFSRLNLSGRALRGGVLVNF